jgi:hypothetical protein
MPPGSATMASAAADLRDYLLEMLDRFEHGSRPGALQCSLGVAQFDCYFTRERGVAGKKWPSKTQT